MFDLGLVRHVESTKAGETTSCLRHPPLVSALNAPSTLSPKHRLMLRRQVLDQHLILLRRERAPRLPSPVFSLAK